MENRKRNLQKSSATLHFLQSQPNRITAHQQPIPITYPLTQQQQPQQQQHHHQQQQPQQPQQQHPNKKIIHRSL